MLRFNKQKKDAVGTGAMLNPDYWNQINRDNDEKTRRWMAEDMMKRGGPAGMNAASHLMGLGTTERGQDVQERVAGLSNETARYGHDVTAQRATGHDATLLGVEKIRTAGSPLDNRIKGAQAADAEQISAMRGKFIDPKTSDTERAQIANYLRALGGKSGDENKPWAHVVGGGVDEATGQMRPQYIVTGRGDQPTSASTGSDIAKRGQDKPVPTGYTVAGTSGGKRVLQDAKGNRFLEG